MVAIAFAAGLVPMIHGSPAIGKSSIINQIADKYHLKVIDLRLAQCDPTDLNGFPSVMGERARYLPMDTFPLEGDELPAYTNKDGSTVYEDVNGEKKVKRYDGWLLFLDEMTSAPKAVQAAGYKIVLDRMVGQKKLHERVMIACAGNMESDNAIVEEMSTAMQSRLVHLELVVDAKEWIEWATSNGVDYRITSFINFKPGMIYTFKPDHTDFTYSSPRTLAFANQILKHVDIKDPDALPLLAGTLSEGVAYEFKVFCAIFDKLPTIAAITDQPNAILVPDEPSVLFALCGSIAHHATKDNVTPLLTFASRMPVEFQVVMLREMIRRDKTLMGHPAVQAWIAKSAMNLF